MKRLTAILLTFCISLGMNTVAFASSDTVKIKVNGSLLSDAQAILKDGSTLLPVRSVSTALGGEVLWDNDTKTASIDKDGTAVAITIGKKEINVNGKKQAISTTAQIVNGRTYVPLRALGEALECDITWVNATKTVEITQQADPSEYKAWYEVDEQGRLVVKTNINSNNWGGYTIVTKLDVDNDNWRKGHDSWDTEHREKQGIVQLKPRGFYSHFEDGTVIKSTELYFFKGIIPTLRDSMKDPQKEIAAVSDKLVYHAKLNNKITITESDQSITLTGIHAAADNEKFKKTFTVSITDELQSLGEYDLFFTKNKKQRSGAGLSRNDTALKCTTDINFFSYNSNSGTFCVEHSVYSMDKNGNVTLTKTPSNEISSNSISHS